MDQLKAEFLTETLCYIAFLNKHFCNPPLEISTLDCIAAERPYPCSLCLARANRTLEFPAPDNTPKFPPLTEPTSISNTRPTGSKKFALTRKERENAKPRLKTFRNSLRVREHSRGRFLEHPQIMFFPPSTQTIVLDNLLRISSLADLQQLVNTWRHCDAHSPALYDAIVEIRAEIAEQREEARVARNAAARKTRAAKRKAAELSDDTEEEEEEVEESSEASASEADSDDIFPATVPIPQKRLKSAAARKRPALKTVTNTKRARIAPPSPLTSAKIAQDYRPQYKPRVRR
jgi:hypothetical protein